MWLGSLPNCSQEAQEAAGGDEADEAEGDGDGGGDDEPAELDPYDLADPVDVLAKVWLTSFALLSVSCHIDAKIILR